MSVDWAKDIHHNDNPDILEDQAESDVNAPAIIDKTTWYYLCWSFELQADMESTDVVYWINNSVRTTKKTFLKTFFLDKATYVNYIGITQTGAATWDRRFDGFIHNFAVY
jgi:hypothetical protein